LVLNSDYNFERGQAAVLSGAADAITYGRPFLANPDLPHRFAHGIALNPDDPKTWYSQGAEGYIDYPVHA
jgi:2,4-dienoyl-CoA reductase-like NADH-dependent reductase (Old Yellow Enzyme family)